MTENQKKSYKFITDNHTFNVAEDKNQNTLNIFTDEKVYVPSTETYKRNTKNHKKGDNKSYAIWTPKYTNIIDAWKDNKYYKQVSTGLNHIVRNCIYIDIDNDIIDTYRYKKCSIEPTFVIRNPKTGHGAFLFVLNENSSYKFLKPYWKTLTKELDGDLNYKGWQCKNPFNKNIEIITSNEKLLYSMEFIQKNVVPTYDNNNTNEQKQGTKSNSILSSSIIVEGDHLNNNINTTSRNDNFLSIYRYSIWEYMNKNKGIAPVETARTELAEKADDLASNGTGKQPKRFTDEKEYKRSENAIYEWTVEHYKENGGHTCTWNNKAREIAEWVKACTKIIDYKKVYELKGSEREIANLTGFSKTKVHNLLSIDGDEKDRIILCANKLKNYVENCTESITDNVLEVYRAIFSSENN